jgi:hypothetical protein
MNEGIDLSAMHEPDRDAREDRVVAAVLERTRNRRPPSFDLSSAILDAAPMAALAVAALSVAMLFLPDAREPALSLLPEGSVITGTAVAEQLIRQNETPSIEAFVVALEQR